MRRPVLLSQELVFLCSLDIICITALLFSTTLCNHHAYTTCNHKDTNREEEPEEPLGIVTKDPSSG